MADPSTNRGRSSSPPTASSHSSPSSDYPSDLNVTMPHLTSIWSQSERPQEGKAATQGLSLDEVLKEDAFGPATENGLAYPESLSLMSHSLQLYPFNTQSQDSAAQALLHYPPISMQSPVTFSPMQLQPQQQLPPEQCPGLIYPMSQEGSPTDYSTSYFYSTSHPQTPASSSASPQARSAAIESSGDPSLEYDVVHPPSTISGLKIAFATIPVTGAKSRVETQIKVSLQLIMPDTDGLGGCRVGTWNWIRLEKGAALRKRPRNLAKVGPEPKPSEVLQLVATVHPASQPSLTAYRCGSCHQREVKRTARKLALRVRPPPSPSASPEPGSAVGSRESDGEEDDKRMVIFNCTDLQELRSGEVSLPTRIVCYCRHHREKVGFLVVFKLYAHDGRLVAEGTTPPIMITDDHKSRNPAGESDPSLVPRDQPLAPSSTVRQVDDSLPKRRRAVDDAGEMQHERRPRKKNRSAASTPPIGARGLSPLHLGMPLPPTPVSALPQTVPAGSSAFPLLQSLGLTAPSMPLPPQPKIFRLIPPSGPVAGGIEVTLLGQAFNNTTAPVFGDSVASSWTMYGDNAIVCILPPSPCPGPVRVSLDGVEPPLGEEPVVFCYEDQSDKALMELALQVVGLKMNGRIDNARDVAMQIMVTGRDVTPESSAAPAGGGMQYTHTMYTASRFLRQTPGTRGRDFQSTIMALIQLLETPFTSRDTMIRLLSTTSSTGLTLLHLAVILNFHRLCERLITLGIDLDARDANGFTALHFAALHGRVRSARLLVEAGADTLIVQGMGLTPADLARLYDEQDIREVCEDRCNFRSSDSEGMDADESAAEDLSDSSGNGLHSTRDGLLSSPLSSSPRLALQVLPAVARNQEDVPSPSSDSFDEFPPLPDAPDPDLEDPAITDASAPPPPYSYWPATLVDYSAALLQRALLQLQPPPSMMPWEKMPSVMPSVAWEKMVSQLHLPNVPLVFHVNVPSWPPALTWPAVIAGQGDEKTRGLYGSAWWQRAETIKGKGNVRLDTGSSIMEQPGPLVGGPSEPRHATVVKTSRRVRYDNVDITDGEVNSFAYQTATDTRKLHNDRMLVLFWIPILIIVVSFAAFQSAPYVYSAVQASLRLFSPRLLPLHNDGPYN